MQLKITYEVRFTCYQYNMGGGDLANGYKKGRKSFDFVEEAFEYGYKIKGLVWRDRDRFYPEESKEIAENFVYAGYIARYDGVFKITHSEEEIYES
jgi:hypothetical protein